MTTTALVPTVRRYGACNEAVVWCESRPWRAVRSALARKAGAP